MARPRRRRVHLARARAFQSLPRLDLCGNDREHEHLSAGHRVRRRLRGGRADGGSHRGGSRARDRGSGPSA